MLGAGLLLLAWAALAFWTFSFAFSGSFFRWNLPSRLPPFVAAWAGATLLPVSAAWQWARVRRQACGPFEALGLHVAGAALSVAPLLLVTAVQRRMPEPWRLSADDAMGVGIDLLILLGAAVASTVLLGLALLIERRLARGPSA
jgi:hypothetical protein